MTRLDGEHAFVRAHFLFGAAQLAQRSGQIDQQSRVRVIECNGAFQ
jgi:hypothetical protein